jgi:hypothetical protein
MTLRIERVQSRILIGQFRTEHLDHVNGEIGELK